MGKWDILISNCNFIGRRAHYKHTMFYCAPQFYTSRCCIFLQIEGKTLHQHKDYKSFYHDIHFIMVVGNPGTEPSVSLRYARIWVVAPAQNAGARHCPTPLIFEQPCGKYSLGYLSNLDYLSNYLRPCSKYMAEILFRCESISSLFPVPRSLVWMYDIKRNYQNI